MSPRRSIKIDRLRTGTDGKRSARAASPLAGKIDAMNLTPQSKRTLIIGLIVFVIAIPLLGVALHSKDDGPRLRGSAAVTAALANPAVKKYVTASKYTGTRVLPLDDTTARVTFYAGPRVIAEAAVAQNGVVTHTQVIAADYVRAGARSMQKALPLICLTLFFLLLLLDLPFAQLKNLDVVVLASSTLTLWLLNERLFGLSTWLSIPLLGYLALRAFWVGFDGPGADREARPLVGRVIARIGWPERTALYWAFGLATMVAAAVTVPGGTVGDVAEASLSGATQLLHGNLPYGHVMDGIVHGDTYPLFAYIVYAPVAAITPVYTLFDNFESTLWIALVALLVSAWAILVAAGRAGGRSFGLRHAAAWLIFPSSLITASAGSNDLPTAMFVAIAIATIGYAGRSVFALSLAAWAKVVPVLVLPMWIASYRERGWKRSLIGPVGISLLMLAILLAYDGTDGLDKMIEGIKFQSARGNELSPWVVFDVPAIHVAVQAAVIAAAVGAACAVWQAPAIANDPRRVCALAAGIMLGVQLAGNYWSYAYLPWVYPLIVAGLLWPSRIRPATRLAASDGPPDPGADSGA